MGISTLAARNGLNGQTLRRQYKEKISGYRNWNQLGHPGEYVLYPENLGADMSMDETCLSNVYVYTILTNKAAHGRKPYAGKGRIPVAQFTAEAGYNLHLVSDYSQTFHLYGGLSALGGYETVNWGRHTLSDGSTLHNGDAFIYGGALTLSADFYLSDKIALTANVKERFIFGNSTGHFHTQYGVGVKFIIE